MAKLDFAAYLSHMCSSPSSKGSVSCVGLPRRHDVRKVWAAARKDRFEGFEGQEEGAAESRQKGNNKV
jgi:hypothetical protein